MTKEIEKKFLVDTDHPAFKKLLTTKPKKIAQGYVSSNEKGVVRVRIQDDTGYLTIKSANIGISRDEYEYEIPLADAEKLIRSMCDTVVRKKRYVFPLEHSLIVEVDVFEDIELTLAEVELPDVSATFEKPDWFLKEVSTDPKYFNNNIATEILLKCELDSTS